MARFLPALLFLIPHLCVALSLDVPKLEKRVTDLAGLLSEEQARTLEQKLQNLESTDSTQIAVLIIPSLEGEPLEDYSHRVASAWRLGQKGRDNGALLLLAMKERKVRIEVGYGLEGKLTDALSRRIIQQEIVPNFRAGNYAAGIDAAVEAMIQVVRGEYKAPDPSTQRSSRSPFSLGRLFWFILPFFFVLRFFGKWLGAIVGGFAGYHLLALLALPWWGSLLLGGAGGMIVGFILGSMIPQPRGNGRGPWHAGRSGPWIGFPGGGDFGGGGGGFSGGGFSGGGGSFGGGGSSGSW